MRLSLKQLERLAEEIPPWEWPEETGPALLETLKDARSTEQELLLAAELAGNYVVVDDDLVAALLAIVRNGQISEDLRGSAAIALGPALEAADNELVAAGGDTFGDPRAVPISASTFSEIRRALRELYADASVPKLVRRRVLEASVRTSEDWHKDAIREAFAGDADWKQTAVFAMRFVAGFDEQILASLKSQHPGVHLEAVLAAGAHELDGAWQHVLDLVHSADTDKELLLAAIDAVGAIRPDEAPAALDHLQDSDDPDIEEAVLEATSMAGGLVDDDDEFIDDEEEPS